MLRKILRTEIDYQKLFSKTIDYGSHMKFWDDQIKDMRSHNNIFIKEGIRSKDIFDIVRKALNERKSEGLDFLKVISVPVIRQGLLDRFQNKPDVDIYDYMGIASSKGNLLKTKKETRILLADNKMVSDHGKFVDIEANKQDMGEEFATRRINRKFNVYNDESSGLDLYVCYSMNEPVGNCELLICDGISKIEDFDILKKHQRKGFGTHFLKELLSISVEKGVEYSYVVTGHEDTAKEMYRKCGFQYIGCVTELLFSI